MTYFSVFLQSSHIFYIHHEIIVYNFNKYIVYIIEIYTVYKLLYIYSWWSLKSRRVHTNIIVCNCRNWQSLIGQGLMFSSCSLSFAQIVFWQCGLCPTGWTAYLSSDFLFPSVYICHSTRASSLQVNRGINWTKPILPSYTSTHFPFHAVINKEINKTNMHRMYSVQRERASLSAKAMRQHTGTAFFWRPRKTKLIRNLLIWTLPSKASWNVCTITAQEAVERQGLAVDLPERLSRMIRFLPCFRLMLRRYLWTGAGPWSSVPLVKTCCEEQIHVCVLWQHMRCRTGMHWNSPANTHRVFQRIEDALIEEITLFTGHLQRQKRLRWHFFEWMKHPSSEETWSLFAKYHFCVFHSDICPFHHKGNQNWIHSALHTRAKVNNRCKSSQWNIKVQRYHQSLF